jgi:hypothetical protein
MSCQLSEIPTYMHAIYIFLVVRRIVHEIDFCVSMKVEKICFGIYFLNLYT